MDNNEQRNLSIATSLCQSWNNHDPEGFAEHFTDDGIWLLARGSEPDGYTVRGKTAIRDMFQHFCETFPDLHAKVRCHWANGADRACSEWHITGKNKNGEDLNWLGLDLWTFNEMGKVTRCDAYYKAAGNLSGKEKK